MAKKKVLVWDENGPHVPKETYPTGIRGAVAEGLQDDFDVVIAHFDEPDQGLQNSRIDEADAIVWWGHVRHDKVDDAPVERIYRRVTKEGLGFVALHSGHYSKPFRRITGRQGYLKGGWREDDGPEDIRVCAPWHPIAEGLSDFRLDHEEMYGAPFDVPPPLVMILQSHFPNGGETFGSGLCWTVGDGIDPDFESGGGNGQNQGEGVGRVFYFRPGHETLPTYFNVNVRKVILNACKWVTKLT